MAGHCIIHPELLASDLILWEPMHGSAQQGRTRHCYLSILLKEVRPNSRGNANPDARQGYMEEVIWRRSGLVPT